jgi:hypothetical protein
MRHILLVVFLFIPTGVPCRGADPAPALSIHYVHPNSQTICLTEPVTAPKGYRLMKLDGDRMKPPYNQSLVVTQSLLTQADLKSITLARSSGGPGCDLVFPEAMRARLKAIRLNDTTGTVAVVLAGETLVTEVSTLNFNDLRISFLVHSKTSLDRLTKLAAIFAPK